jgi:phosphoenolpyruvate carboxykinase (ATP)
MINAVLEGKLAGVSFEPEPFFGLQIPTQCPGVPVEILNTRNTWANKSDYDAQARKLANMFAENFKQYAQQATPEILAAGPSITS